MKRVLSGLMGLLVAMGGLAACSSSNEAGDTDGGIFNIPGFDGSSRGDSGKSGASTDSGKGEAGLISPGQCGEKMNISLASTGAGACVACGAGCINGDLCLSAGNVPPISYCAADCSTTPCPEGQSCMENAECAPLFDCGNPATTFPCATRSPLDSGKDVALLVAPDGKHVAAARGFKSTAGVMCAGNADVQPDGEVGSLAALPVSGAPAPVVVNDVAWRSVTFSNDSQYLAYVGGVTDLCSHSGTLMVAKADGSAPRAIVTGQYSGTFALVGNYVVYPVPAAGATPCSLAAVPLAGGATKTLPTAQCVAEVFNNIVVDPAGSAFLVGGQVTGYPMNQLPNNAAQQAAALSGVYFYGGGVSLVDIPTGTVDTFNPYESNFAWSPDGTAVAVSVNVNEDNGFTSTGMVTVATVSGATPDVTANCQCNATPVFSPDSTQVMWDGVDNSGQTIASAAVILARGGSTTTIGGLPGSKVTQLGFTADGQNVFAVDSGLLLVAPMSSAATFATLVQDVTGGFAFAPSSDHVAVVRSTYGNPIDVYPLTGGASVVAATPAGPMTTTTQLTLLSGALSYEPVNDKPALLLTGETLATGLSFAELTTTNGSKGLLEANLGLSSSYNYGAFWSGRVLVFTTSSTLVNDPAGGLEAGSVDIAGVADDGSLGGTLARAVTFYDVIDEQLFYLRSDEPGVWRVPIPQPAD